MSRIREGVVKTIFKQALNIIINAKILLVSYLIQE